jgi:serine/threonine-protein kinase
MNEPVVLSLILPELAGWRFRHLLSVTDFSEIWLAEDLALKRPVAAKIFSPRPNEDGFIPPFPVEEWRRRFFQEARLLARLDHPHIVPMTALSTLKDGRPAMMLQYLPANLSDEIGLDLFKPSEVETAATPDQLPRATTVERTRQVLLALLSALVLVHRKGVVHRDVKPRNLLLTGGPGGAVKLCDFGMAKPPEGDPPMEAHWIGTRDYIAPEQFADAQQATDRSDVFSAGVVGIRMLTGHFPDRQRLAAVPNLPKGFGDLLVQALEFDPLHRPTAEQMLQGLRGLR